MNKVLKEIGGRTYLELELGFCGEVCLEWGEIGFKEMVEVVEG